jgi:hypothetical protein
MCPFVAFGLPQKTQRFWGFDMADDDELGQTMRLMSALVKMKPKPHEEMKLGKKTSKKKPKKQK